MCLGIPGKIVEIDTSERSAVVEAFGVKRRVDTSLLDQEIALGDYLMVHAGFAIGRIDGHEAQASLSLFEGLLDGTDHG